MKNIKKYNLAKACLGFAIVAGIMFTFSSCKKYLDPGQPATAVTTASSFEDSTTATALILGLYSSGQMNGAVQQNNRYGTMSADDAYEIGKYTTFQTNTLAATDDAENIWAYSYFTIGRANNIIEGLLQPTPNITTSLRNQLLGEAYFSRAYNYYFLVNFFGDVPLVTSSAVLATKNLPRAPAASIYTQMVQDLIQAEGLLTDAYPSPDRARVNRSAASAMLARVYFMQHNWPAAEAEATKVISSGNYSLETDLNQVFKISSNETIWQLANNSGVTPTGSEWLPSGGSPKSALYDTLLNAFEPGDLRLADWVDTLSSGGTTYYYPYKYKLQSGFGGDEYTVLLRLGEVYLTRAEARINQNDLAGGQADINVIRTRAGLPNTTAATQADLLLAVEKERWKELFTESSDRWFNLKRLGKTTATLLPIKPLWQPFQNLYPIPQTEIFSNPYLKQNPGY